MYARDDPTSGGPRQHPHRQQYRWRCGTCARRPPEPHPSGLAFHTRTPVEQHSLSAIITQVYLHAMHPHIT